MEIEKLESALVSPDSLPECPLCGAKEIERCRGEDYWFEFFRDGFGQAYKAHYCRACKGVTFHPHAHIDMFYEKYIPQSELAVREGYPYYLEAARNILRTLPNGATILDLGCGEGSLFRHLAATMPHFRFVGVESDTRRAKLAAQSGNVQLIESSIIDFLETTTGHFEAICMFDVLEHLPDPATAIAKVNSSLADNGVFVITVPNRDRATFFIDAIINDFPPPHLYRFRPSTLLAVLGNAGLTVETLTTLTLHDFVGFGKHVLKAAVWNLRYRVMGEPTSNRHHMSTDLTEAAVDAADKSVPVAAADKEYGTRLAQSVGAVIKGLVGVGVSIALLPLFILSRVRRDSIFVVSRKTVRQPVSGGDDY